ncbi:hypothetical protein VQ03_00190 [Methylobacterium tarhaniae]|uniref:Uncharacterized protein n=1 Tax=Methylobacterium tarhaniae TaxID=1187852 RepID=A0A0J6W0A6_9HYPH|nr:hypothetical protein [Methylobacterium tarhaniae]KMO44986.1 hypothetical protein VQ03_00190 [Methylobacterium tarhaniae]
MQDRPALKAALRALVLLAGLGLVPRQEPHLDEDREGTPHPGFREPKGFVLGQGPPVDRDRT